MAGSSPVPAAGYAEVRVREPLGERAFGDTLTLGGEGAQLQMPGCPGGVRARIARSRGTWTVSADDAAGARLNGQVFLEERALAPDDVLAIGEAQLVVSDLSRTRLRLDAHHLIGNATTPAGQIAVSEVDESEDVEIHAPAPSPAGPESGASNVTRSRSAQRALAALRRPRSKTLARVLTAFAVLVALLLTQLRVVRLDVQPADARILTPGTALALHLGPRLLMLPGLHVVRAERRGYIPAQTQITLTRGASRGLQLSLVPLPGLLSIDTGGVSARVRIDGVDSGAAPGILRIPAGVHTVTLQAPHFVDDIESVTMVGAGQQQSLQVRLQPSWGTLQITSATAGARVSVDGSEHGAAPVGVQLPSGIHRVRISAPGHASWESSVVLQASTVMSIGPVSLGQPGIQLQLMSEPAGAAAMVDGELRGRTPMQLELAAGAPHALELTLQGYQPWRRQLEGRPGERVALRATLEAEALRVTVDGEPQGAQLRVDGMDAGTAPRVLQLSGIAHRLEIGKQGWTALRISVSPASGLDRHVHYRLQEAQAAAGAAQPASLIYTQTGYALRRVEPEGAVRRPFYLGVATVTNEQFRQFRVDHVSERPGSAVDAGHHPVVQVSRQDAIGFCNWLSERDNLPPAYERIGDRFVLQRTPEPGYRLPTRAELNDALHQGSLEPSKMEGEWVGDDPVRPAGAGSSNVSFRVARDSE